MRHTVQLRPSPLMARLALLVDPVADRLGLHGLLDSACLAASRGNHRRRKGLSLLEVMLALAILGVACVFMAQAMQVAASNAIAAERQAQAELAAESVMSEIIAGVIPLQPSTTWTPTSSSSNWSYMLQLVTCEVQNMVGIQLQLRDESDPDTGRPADLTVIRWIIDPTLGLDMPPDATGMGTDAAGQTGQGTTGAQAGAASGGLNGKF
jgi:general secretion pathway protein I